MALSDLGERFARVPTQQKYIGLVLALGLLGAAFYFMFYSELSDKENQLVNQMRQLEVKKASYEKKKQNYMAFRAAVKKLLRKKKELLKELPTTAEIPSFLQSLHAQAELAGLNIKTFRKQKELRRGFYGEIPVRMEIEGTYHQITKFFYSIGNLKRIVTIKDVLLRTSPKTTSMKGKMGVMLKAKFVASTFRFIEGGKRAPRGRRGRSRRHG